MKTTSVILNIQNYVQRETGLRGVEVSLTHRRYNKHFTMARAMKGSQKWWVIIGHGLMNLYPQKKYRLVDAVVKDEQIGQQSKFRISPSVNSG
jgi:hypothetical protein